MCINLWKTLNLRYLKYEIFMKLLWYNLWQILKFWDIKDYWSDDAKIVKIFMNILNRICNQNRMYNNYTKIFNDKNEILIINLKIYIIFKYLINIFIYIFYYILSFTQKINIYIISLSVNNISTIPNIIGFLVLVQTK